MSKEDNRILGRNTLLGWECTDCNRGANGYLVDHGTRCRECGRYSGPDGWAPPTTLQIIAESMDPRTKDRSHHPNHNREPGDPF